MGEYSAPVRNSAHTAAMNTNTNKYVDVIWSEFQKHARAPGMGNYGRGLEVQREYYRALSPAEKRQYEDAVLVLCKSENTQRADLALNTCADLADLFPSDWSSRVVSLVATLVKAGLAPRYKDTTTYSRLRLIWEFHMESLMPSVIGFSHLITTNLKQGELAMAEWELLYAQVSRIFIRVAPEDFWKEVSAFHEDRDLLDLLGPETKAVIHLWVSFGALTYGLEWLSAIVRVFAGFSERSLREEALLSVQQSSGGVVFRDPTKTGFKKEFLKWAEDQLDPN